MDDELEVNLDLVHLLHAQDPVVVANRLVQHRLDVVDDVLQDLVVHAREHNQFKEGVDGAQELVSVGSDLVDEEVAHALVGVVKLAALRSLVILVLLLALARTLPDLDEELLGVVLLLQHIEFLFRPNFDVGDQDVLDVDNDGLVAVVDVVLLQLVLQTGEVREV